MIPSLFVSAAFIWLSEVEKKGMGAFVYLISIIGNILRDLHFYLVITAVQWIKFLLLSQI